MTRAKLIAALCTFVLAAGAGSDAWSQETLKVAIPQRGAWDAGVAELGQRGGIFKKRMGSISKSFTSRPARNRSRR